MKKLIIIGFILLIATTAFAANNFLLLGIGSMGNSFGPPPVCTNKLDFSDACNSQYFVAIGF